MSDAPREIAIVGPGLIGTSIALAARRRWADVGIRSIDKGQTLSGIAGADIVVLAAPVDAILDIIPKLRGVVRDDALVLDTGSTKRAILEAATQAQLPRFVGGHPMAGRAQAGPAEARADMFDGRPWFLVNPDAPDAVRSAAHFVEALGARPVIFNDRGDEHDRLMAALSHLPQITSTALMAVVARSAGLDNLPWAGNGLRDTTRLASSEAAMWQSILATNSREIKPLVAALAAELAAIAERLEDDRAVRALFEEANRARAALK